TGPVRRQSSAHGLAEPFEGDVAFRGGRIAAAVTPQDVLLRSDEEAHPGQVVIEVEKSEIDTAHARDPHQHELPSHVGDLLVQTSHLPVKYVAVRSVLATEDDEERLAFLASRGQ